MTKDTLANIILVIALGIGISASAILIPAYLGKPPIVTTVLQSSLFDTSVKYSSEHHSILCINDDNTLTPFTKEEFFLIPEQHQQQCTVYSYTGKIAVIQ